MNGIVYVDMLIFVNALIGYFLLRAAALLAGNMISGWRIFCGAGAAGLSSLVLLLPPAPLWLMYGTKIGCAILIVFIAFPVHSVRAFLKCSFWYALLNLIFSGVMFAVMYYSESLNVKINNMAVYFNISPVMLIGCITVTYLVLRLGTAWFGKPEADKTVPFAVRFGNKTFKGTALQDTGFSLSDPSTGLPAVMLSFPAVKNKLPEQIFNMVSLYFKEGIIETGGIPMHLVPVKTASGVRAFPVFHAQELTIGNAASSCKFTHVCTVFSSETFADGGFSAIIPVEMQR